MRITEYAVYVEFSKIIGGVQEVKVTEKQYRALDGNEIFFLGAQKVDKSSCDKVRIEDGNLNYIDTMGLSKAEIENKFTEFVEEKIDELKLKEKKKEDELNKIKEKRRHIESFISKTGKVKLLNKK